MRRRIFSLILAAAMLLAALPAALAAGRPALFCELEEGGGAVLSLEDAGSGVYGVQLELTLAGEYPDCVFTPDSLTAYAPDCSVRTLRGETRVTIYLTDRSAMEEEGGYLPLGVLDPGGDVPETAWPDTARVTLLDEKLRPAADALTIPANVLSAPSREPQTPSQLPAEPSLPPENPLPFADVNPGDWFYDAVRYVYGKNIMQGVGPDAFDPYTESSRAMIVTILHRLEGSPAALPAGFADVDSGAYYAGPVAWASESGIVTGFSPERFRPGDSITREQLAAILYRYTDWKGLDVSHRGDLGIFPDRGDLSPYAVEAMSWAVAEGLINGINGNLAPSGRASRAQTAALLQRFCESVLKLS